MLNLKTNYSVVFTKTRIFVLQCSQIKCGYKDDFDLKNMVYHKLTTSIVVDLIIFQNI